MNKKLIHTCTIGNLGETRSGFFGSGLIWGLTWGLAFKGFNGGDDLIACCCGGWGGGVFSVRIGGRGEAEKIKQQVTSRNKNNLSIMALNINHDFPMNFSS